ncbi:MAG: ribonuclease J [Candidatus Komeilibacteria bacterium]|nr:ribonuclease J [Candidatus Komeilibacteria bacterium]
MTLNKKPTPSRRPHHRSSARGHQSFERRATSNKLRIIPLGGLEEVGKNMTVFEYGNDIIILDMGLKFPEEDMHGIDYIIPNVSCLRGKEKNIRAVIFSHGHLDHIGAAPILLEKLGYPIILGRPLTLAMIKHRQDDYKKSSGKQLKTLQIKSLNDRFNFGAFKVSFFQVDHSVMDAMGVILQTPVGTVIHPGDWTLEKDPNGKPILDYEWLSKIKRPTILMLESLGAIDVRTSATHEQMRRNINKLIVDAPGRVIIGTFASQIERVGWLLAAAEHLGKKVALDGYSMKMNIEIAKKLGYIKTKKDTLIRVEDIDDYPDKKIIVIVTGAQGESTAVLSRVITGSHRHLKLRKTDTVILSSSIIPGNEATVQKLKDALYRQSDNVIHGQIMDIHVSGHGNRDDIAYVLTKVKPDYFVPVYAYHYMLREAAKLARDMGFDPRKILVLDNGQVAEFDQRGGQATDKRVETANVFVDGLGVGDIGNVVLRDRQVMAEDGMLVVIIKISAKTGKPVGEPEIITRGFVYVKSSDKLLNEAKHKIKTVIQTTMGKSTPDKIEDWNNIRGKLRDELSEFFFKETERQPMILPVIIKV